eukprot:CAMPEP_0198220040 /NCGR_PEP_ID=MMETSP1445-20131203/77288_1 /TAXON_ID=36898 /ORGANISM="Pyramimonas sp., Strain CCMP2087" /LENGTH=105 /DNA_ID=CAMNT_0043897665 /DNA_START=189 /DNA_END=503 /DNA_ORIENTATION=-
MGLRQASFSRSFYIAAVLLLLGIPVLILHRLHLLHWEHAATHHPGHERFESTPHFVPKTIAPDCPACPACEGKCPACEATSAKSEVNKADPSSRIEVATSAFSQD